jgi:signal transduction histidine kinase/AmiR/NasT family two-component response regulator
MGPIYSLVVHFFNIGHIVVFYLLEENPTLGKSHTAVRIVCAICLHCPRVTWDAEQYNGMKGKLLEISVAMACGFFIQANNKHTLARMRELRDQAISASEDKLTFIAKMRFVFLARRSARPRCRAHTHTHTCRTRALSECSHDLRTPLVGLFGFCEMLKESGLAPKQADTLRVIYFSANLLNHLIANLLDFSRIERGQLTLNSEVFNLHSMIRYLSSFFNEFSRQKRVQLDITVDSTVPRNIRSDKTRLTQIAINLVSNALKFTSTGRNVTVHFATSARCCSEMSRDVAEHQASSLLVMRVHDEGIGISQENIGHLFRPSTISNRPSASEVSGLGLYICSEFARLMKGHICCESKLGVGSTFTFVCPFESANEQFVRQTVTSSGSCDGYMNFQNVVREPNIEEFLKANKILVAEDNKVNQMVITNMLKKLNCTFDIVDDGDQACKQFERSEYFLVLMDMMMPVMDGYEATRRISVSNKFLETKPLIVAVTASVTEKEIEDARAAGCVDVISKPVNVNRLKDAIARAVQNYTRARSRRFTLGAQNVSEL